MTIKLRILLLQIVVGLAVVVMAGVAFAATQAMTASLERVRWSNQQLDAATQLQVLANRYSEQVAELLLVGASEHVDFDDARDRMATWFHNAEEMSRREMASLDDAAEQAEERVELKRLERMRRAVPADRPIGRTAVAAQPAGSSGGSHRALQRADREPARRGTREPDCRDSRRRTPGDGASERRVRAAGTPTDDRHDRGAGGDPRRLDPAGRPVPRSHCATATRARARQRRQSGGANWATASATRSRTRSAGSLKLSTSWRSSSSASAATRSRRSRSSKPRSSSAPPELAEVNRRLTELDEQRVRFLADVSHELRTPLTVLRGEAEVALRGMSKPEAVYRESLE